MRIVGGRLGGRTLTAPKGAATRPTSDRVRQALFNILEHGLDGPDLEGGSVIDLFAGSGALGLEALSRGARSAMLVDTDAAARGAMRANIEALGLEGVAKILRRDATKLGPCLTPGAFTHAFLDPPYGRGLADLALVALRDGRWLADGAIVVIEEEAGATVSLPERFAAIERRAYGDTVLLFARAAGEPA
ncbi:MAG: 16S rRNA (guanine(966)-N(2))-methyltransferase RsmD [Hyphomicrobiaceae bacterium]|nr:16S rRNA (guanine(966)-N(2))-methyltransferase RsmD [Hyphomicrobiaceae bacterium]